MKKFSAVLVTSAIVALTACDSDDNNSSSDDNDNTAVVSEPGTFQVTFTNMTAGQLMTPPVVALHDPSVHLFQVGAEASDAIRDIAETGNSAELVAFAGANPTVVSAAAVVGEGPFGAGGSVTGSLSTSESGQVFSAVNMVICTNDGISGVDSIALPAGNEPVTVMAMAYDAGTRVNQADALSFFPPPCAAPTDTGGGTGDNEAPVEDPRAAIAAHGGQAGLSNAAGNWNFATGDEVLQIEIVRN